MTYVKIKKTIKKSSDCTAEEITGLLQEFDNCKAEVGLTKFCQDRQISCTTFRSWIKKRRNGDLSNKGRFIELPSLASVQFPSVSETLFASLCINGIELKLYQQVEPSYLYSLLNNTTTR